MGLAGRIMRIYDRILDVMAFAAGVFAVAVMLLICYLVVMRYIFIRPPGWIIEVSEYLLLYITFLGAGWLLRKNGHVRVDLFVAVLPRFWEKAIAGITSLVGAISCMALAGLGVWVTANNYIRGISSIQTISVPRWILLAVIPLGAFFLSIQFLRDARKAFKESRNSGEEPGLSGRN